jgi:hypothetical protein
MQKDTSKLSKNESINPQLQTSPSTEAGGLASDGLQLPLTEPVSHALPAFEVPPHGATQGPDFDLESLRLSQDFAASTGVRKLLTTVAVRKPDGQEFIRVHPAEAWRLPTMVLRMKEDRAVYFVDQALWPDLMLRREIVPAILFTTMTRQGVLCLWPIRLPGADGRLDTWNQSALAAASVAMTSWIRVRSNTDLGAYEVEQAVNLADDPDWSGLDFRAIVKIACKDRLIQSQDHHVLRRLRGEL